MFIDDDFHFVDARLEQKNFAGERPRARFVDAHDSVQAPVHRAFNGASHRDQIIDESFVENRFRLSSGTCHDSPSARGALEITPLLVVDTVAKRWLRFVHKKMNVRINPWDGGYKEIQEKGEPVTREVRNA